MPVLLFAAGCTGANNRTVRSAGAAEERGDAHIAYDAYCQAARQDPGDVRVVSALKRLAPTAAAYWDSQARIAASKGEYGEAWRMGVKSLDIRPDQPGMAEFLRQLETEHPDAVASALREWERTGKVKVASVPQATTKDEPRQVASRSERVYEPQPMPADQPSPVAQEPAASPQNRGAEPPRTYQAPPRTYRAPPARHYQAPSRGSAEPRPTTESPDDMTNYTVMYTLSRDEKHFPKRLRLADGIYMKLRDVNDDRTVDIDLDDGDERVQKIRDMKESQSKLFRGQSGRWYRFTLVDVQLRGEVIRVGLRPG